MHALSIPTWIIHVSSVIEWIAAIWLIWIYGEVNQDTHLEPEDELSRVTVFFKLLLA